MYEPNKNYSKLFLVSRCSSFIAGQSPLCVQVAIAEESLTDYDPTTTGTNLYVNLPLISCKAPTAKQLLNIRTKSSIFVSESWARAGP